MPIDYQTLKNWPFKDTVHTYTVRDTMLYALGLGLGADPLDAGQLAFTYEDGLKALPTMAVVLASPGFWLKDPRTGVDWTRVLHGEQGLVVHKPLPIAATVVGRSRIVEIIDKGTGKGAVMYSQREIREQASGELLAEVTSTTMLRGNGGFGGPTVAHMDAQKVSMSKSRAVPERAADLAIDTTTLPQAALIYRLSGDYNPLHADPAVARSAGFARPILHGLCTYGIAGAAVLRLVCNNDPAKLLRQNVRFSAPVYPGDTIRTEVWRTSETDFAFRARAVERDIVVLDNGFAAVSD